MKFWPGIIVLCPSVQRDRPVVMLPASGDFCGVCGGPLSEHELRMWTADGELIDVRERECNPT